jgi:nucleotide-binding universal stress UspA family protein
LDGSSLAEQALPVAGTIAHRRGMKVHLVSVFEEIPVFFSSLAGAEDVLANPDLQQERRADLTEYLQGTAEALATTHGVETTCALLSGAAAQAVAREAGVRHAGLIVMTTHGHGGLRRLWLGSVADRVLRRVSVPVLLLRSSDKPHPTEFRHLLVALDGSPEGEGVLEPAIQLGSVTQGSRYTLIQVVEPPLPMITRMAVYPARLPPDWRERQEKSAHSYLQRLALAMRARGMEVNAQVFSARGAAEQIAECARGLGADLIVVGTHGARGVERMLLGSVADKVIRAAEQAVLVVPTHREAR